MIEGKKLPRGWVLAPLNEFVDINPPLDRCIINDDVQVTFVPMRAVEAEGGGLVRPETRPYGEVKKGYTSFLSSDVIMAKITPCMENGKVAVVPEVPGDVCFGSTEFHVLRAGKGVQSRWVSNFLLQHDIRRAAQRQMTGGVGQMRVPSAFLESLHVPLAPSAEQARIADALDELFSDLDAGVAALERVQEKLKLYRASVLKAAVEGTLTAEWRVKNPQAEPASELLKRILAERRRRWEKDQLAKFKAKGQEPPKDWKSKYKEPAAPDTANLSSLPKGWKWVSLGQLLHGIEAGKSFTCVPRPARIDEWGIIKVSAMSWGRFDENENKAVPFGKAYDPTYEIRHGDLLLSRSNTVELVGATVFVERCRPQLLLSDKSMRLLYSSLLDPLWLRFTLGSSYARQQISKKATGTSDSMRNISQDNVSAVLVALPPEEEQKIIVETVEGQLSIIDHLESELEAKLKTSQSLRQSILHHAFTGQLVPQDPKDEPASELLKRIAAERAIRAKEVASAKKPLKKSPRVGKGRRSKQQQQGER